MFLYNIALRIHFGSSLFAPSVPSTCARRPLSLPASLYRRRGRGFLRAMPHKRTDSGGAASSDFALPSSAASSEFGGGVARAQQFAELFPAPLQELAIDAASSGASVPDILRILLKRCTEPCVCSQAAAPPPEAGAAQPRADPGPPEAGAAAPRDSEAVPLCACGRTLSRGGGFLRSHCCCHCEEGTHSKSCQKREAIRRRARGR